MRFSKPKWLKKRMDCAWGLKRSYKSHHRHIVAGAAAQYEQVPNPVAVADAVVIGVKVHTGAVQQPAKQQPEQALMLHAFGQRNQGNQPAQPMAA
jgi:hypothetical protein